MVSETTLAIIALSLIFSITLAFIQRRFGGRDRIKEIQAKIKKRQDELTKAMKEKDEKKMEELKKNEKEFLDLMNEMMFLSLKGMIFVLPLALIVFTYLLPALFPVYLLTLSFPVLGFPHFDASFPFIHLVFKNYLGARGLFIYGSLVFGLSLEALLPKIEAKLGKKLF